MTWIDPRQLPSAATSEVGAAGAAPAPRVLEGGGYKENHLIPLLEVH